MKRYHIISLLLLILLLIACSTNNKTGFKLELKNPKLTFLWETDTLLTTIESVIFNADDNLLYTTNINGHWLRKNGKGFISKVNLNGKIESLVWVDGLDGPTGTVIYDNILYVADFDTIVEIDIQQGKIRKKHFVKSAKRINDLALKDDGTIYGTGTLSGKLFSLQKNQVKEVLNNLGRPNGLLVQKNKLLIGLGNPASLNEMNFNSKTLNALTDGISPDGITAIGNGDYLVSEWSGRIYYVKKGGSKTLLLDTSKNGVNSADITYIPSKKMLLVPAMLKNKLMAYRLDDNK